MIDKSFNYKRLLTILSVFFGVYLLVSVQPVVAASVSWNTSTDWDNSGDENSVVHESVANTDHNNASNVSLGYSANSPLYSQNLSAYWLLQEDSGSTAYDFSGNNNDGTISGATVGEAGILSTTAYSFDGGGDDIEVADSNQLDLASGNFSISVWIKYDGSGDTYKTILSKADSSANKAYVLRLDGSDNIGVRIDSSSYWSSTSLNTNSWKQVVWTQTDSNTKIYVNGSIVYDQTTESYDNDNNNVLRIAENSWNGGDNIGGKIADVRIYNRSLSQSEIKTLHNITQGYLETQDKVISGKPNLDATASIHSDTSISVDVIGDPGEASEETNTVSLNDGSNSYSLSWSNSHDNYKINATLSTSNISRTPILSSTTLNVPFNSDEPPIVENNSASPTGGSTIDSQDHVDMSIDVKDPEFDEGDTVDVDFYVDGSQVDSKSIASNQTVTGTWSNPTNGSHTWYVVASDSSALTDTSQTFSFEYKAYSPVLSSPDPDGRSVGSGSVTLSIDIEDRDFGVKGSDSITADFYGNGSFVGSDTLSSNGTASTTWDLSAGGTKKWYVNVSDGYGLYTNSSEFTIRPPTDLQFFSEPQKTPIDDQNITVEFDSLDSGYEATLTTNDSTMQLPVRERLFITVNSSGYVENSFYIFNHTDTWSIGLLPVSDQDQIRYEQCFVLDDKTGGNFPEQNTRLYIYDLDFAIEFDDDGFAELDTNRRYLMGSGYFGGNNLYCEFLVHETIYLLEVRNDNGDIRQYGTYTAVDDGAADRISIGEFAITNTNKLENKGYAFQASFAKTPEQSSPAETNIKYLDRSGNTSYINYTIYQVNRSQKNGSILDKSPVYTLNQSDLNVEYKNTVDLNTDNKTYLVNYTLKRGGEKQNGSISLQDIPQIGNRLPIDQKWLDILGYVFILLVGGLLVPSQPRLAGMGMSLSAILLTAVGVVSIPVAVLGPAAAASLLFLVAGDEVV